MASLIAMEGVLLAAGGEVLPEGVILTEDALQKVLTGQPLEAVVGVLPPL